MMISNIFHLMIAVPTSGVFEEIEGESDERRRLRLERHQKAMGRMVCGAEFLVFFASSSSFLGLLVKSLCDVNDDWFCILFICLIWL